MSETHEEWLNGGNAARERPKHKHVDVFGEATAEAAAGASTDEYFGESRRAGDDIRPDLAPGESD